MLSSHAPALPYVANTAIPAISRSTARNEIAGHKRIALFSTDRRHLGLLSAPPELVFVLYFSDGVIPCLTNKYYSGSHFLATLFDEMELRGDSSNQIFSP